MDHEANNRSSELFTIEQTDLSVITFKRTVPVRFAHCDTSGLMFYPQFFALVNEVVEDWFAFGLRLPFRTLHMERRLGVPTVSFEVEFVAPCRLGDELTQTLSVVAR